MLLPFFGLIALGALQLVPLPASLHAALAPGSAELWHPEEPTAASVLGSGWRPISVHPTATLESVTLGLGLLSLVALAGPAMREGRWRRVSIVSVVLGGLTVAAYGVVARVAFGPLLYGRFAVPTVTPFGPFVSKNHFAGYVGMITFLALGLGIALVKRERGRASPLGWVTRPGADRALFAFGAAATMALSVLVSQSRGGALALLAGSIVFWLLRSRGAPLGRRGALAAACVGAVVVGMWTVLPAEAKQRLVGILGSPDVSGQYRLGVWRDALSAFRHSPWLGQGIGVFEDALPRFKTVAGHLRVEHAENELLELLVEGGLVASLLAGLAVVGVVRSVMRKVADRPMAPTKGEVAGALAGLAALLTHSVFDFSLHVPATLTMAAFLLAVVLAGQFREGSRAGRAPGVLALLVLASALAVSVRTGPTRPLPTQRSSRHSPSGRQPSLHGCI